MAIETRQAVSPREAKSFDTEELRAAFLVESMFAANDIRLTYTHYDRMIVGGVLPVGQEVFLPAVRETGTEAFLDRRELVAVNLGGEGQVVTLSATHTLGPRDMLYLGKGTGPVSFASLDRARPARFYLVSAPAHKELPARLIRANEARHVDAGDPSLASSRVVLNYVHPEIMETCQLVVGITELDMGSVWSSASGNLHSRRTEATLYFGLREDQRVFHFMGEASQTRHLTVANEQAVLSPAWSIRASVGSQSYGFVWATAGDNLDEGDVETVPLSELR